MKSVFGPIAIVSMTVEYVLVHAQMCYIQQHYGIIGTLIHPEVVCDPPEVFIGQARAKAKQEQIKLYIDPLLVM
jgi:hypothetical protein